MVFIIFLLLILLAIVTWGLVTVVKFSKDGFKSIEKVKNWPEDFKDQARACIRKHRYNLNQEIKRLTMVDAYGQIDSTQWENEGLDYFVVNILWPEIGLSELSNIHKSDDPLWNLILPNRQKILQTIKEEIEGISDTNHSNEDINLLSGIEFEAICKDRLEKANWQITTTVASGDQGVDLIATKGGTRVCIQCKRFASPVGNSAVQEVTAGKLHWHGTHAVVVSNAGFTKSAQALARSTGVLLMSHEELADLENRLD
jgi:restriction system protein